MTNEELETRLNLIQRADEKYGGTGGERAEYITELLALRKLATEMRHGLCYAPFSEYADLAARFDALRKEW